MELRTHKRETLKLELGAEVLRSFGELRFVARGASMIPAIFPGDVLLVRHQPLAAMRCGDVALWSSNGCFCAHRVLRIEKNCDTAAIVTCGDTLAQEDTAVTDSELLGHVYAVIRRGKRIELVRKQRFLLRGIAFLARHSDFLTRWLIRYNSVLCAITRHKDSFAQETLNPPICRSARELQ